jgi:transposase
MYYPFLSEDTPPNFISVKSALTTLNVNESRTNMRKFNRKLAGFQYYKLTQYIKYKAAPGAIKVIEVSAFHLTIL